MSRAYRVRIRETLKRVVRGSDHVSTELEILDIVSREETQEILADELVRRGFTRQGATVSRISGSLTLTVDLPTGTVKAQVETGEEVEISTDTHVLADSDWSKEQKARAATAAREKVREGLEERAKTAEREQQRRATEKLGRSLDDVKHELDQVVNRVTAEALKRKASRMGQIKEITEDAENGNLTIVLEV